MSNLIKKLPFKPIKILKKALDKATLLHPILLPIEEIVSNPILYNFLYQWPVRTDTYHLNLLKLLPIPPSNSPQPIHLIKLRV